MGLVSILAASFAAMVPPFVLRDGCLEVPTGPGIGVAVNTAAIKGATVQTFDR